MSFNDANLIVILFLLGASLIQIRYNIYLHKRVNKNSKKINKINK